MPLILFLFWVSVIILFQIWKKINIFTSGVLYRMHTLLVFSSYREKGFWSLITGISVRYTDIQRKSNLSFFSLNFFITLIYGTSRMHVESVEVGIFLSFTKKNFQSCFLWLPCGLLLFFNYYFFWHFNVLCQTLCKPMVIFFRWLE